MSTPAKSFSAPKGTRDVLPPESAAFEAVIGTFAEWARRYGFGLLVGPMFEDVSVFNRGIGEESDVARKEMYIFEDRGGRRLALRPEGTASAVRAFVQHHPTTPWKVWYVTPAFRYERAQAGRYRQHHQVGVEVLGTDDPVVDVEVIALAWRFFEALGLRALTLMVNSMGHAACRAPYLAVLVAHLEAHEAELCDEHQETWRRSPLRVFDCKREPCRRVTDAGPLLIDHLCDDCRAHFDTVTSGLDAVDIPWTLSPRLVRGFDYYTRTAFEFSSRALESAQNAVGGGGRYDQLAEQLGGDPTSGIGFGCGVERVLLALAAENIVVPTKTRVDVFIADTSDGLTGLRVGEQLRAAGFAVARGYDGRSSKAQMKLADRSGAAVALIVGTSEIEGGTVTMRDLRRGVSGEREQSVPVRDVVAAVTSLLFEST